MTFYPPSPHSNNINDKPLKKLIKPRVKKRRKLWVYKPRKIIIRKDIYDYEDPAVLTPRQKVLWYRRMEELEKRKCIGDKEECNINTKADKDGCINNLNRKKINKVKGCKEKIVKKKINDSKNVFTDKTCNDELTCNANNIYKDDDNARNCDNIVKDNDSVIMNYDSGESKQNTFKKEEDCLIDVLESSDCNLEEYLTSNIIPDTLENVSNNESFSNTFSLEEKYPLKTFKLDTLQTTFNPRLNKSIEQKIIYYEKNTTDEQSMDYEIPTVMYVDDTSYEKDNYKQTKLIYCYYTLKKIRSEIARHHCHKRDGLINEMLKARNISQLSHISMKYSNLYVERVVKSKCC